ncbi:hypothetical protein N8328_03700 [Crocinitomicaceae bacterium]|jgi:hypothetical protein|nr:hypothetical protein [Crocinitomicaceae bacterium]
MVFGIPFPLALVAPAFVLAAINYWYWSKKGYKSLGTFIIGVFAMYGLLYYLTKAFV